jgi:hypothetical protein
LQLVCSTFEEIYETADHDGSFYSWEVTGGVIVNGAGTHQITVLWGAPGAGTVSVTETTEEGCSAMAGILNVTIEICGYSQEKISENMSIYPNPASTMVNISINGTQEAQVKKIMIANALGLVMEEIEIHGGFPVFRIDLTGYPSGVYFVKALTNNGWTVIKFTKK